MDWKFLVNIIAGLLAFTQFTISLANVTDVTTSSLSSNEYQPFEIFTTLSSTETSHLIPTANATTEPSVVVTESSKRKKTQLRQERPRRQGYHYQAKYGINTIFDMCPPLALTCPICTNEGVQVPPGFCNSVVLKVLAISPPQVDSHGRVCGKFGMLKLLGDFNEKEFRRLLRFSVSETCGCAVKASGLYFLISPLSTFLKDGSLYNQVVLTEESVLISVDRYIENEILDALNSCPAVGYNPGVSVPYNPPPAPYVPPAVNPPAPYVPPPAPYIPPATNPPNPPVPYVPPPALYVSPATNPPAPYVPPPTKPPVPYVPPPAPYVPPPAPYVPPPTPYVPPPTPYVPPPTPYVPPPTKSHEPYMPPPAPYVPPATNPPTPYVHPPAPYVPPPAPYVPPPTEPPAVYPPHPASPSSYNPPPVPYNPAPVQIPVSNQYQVQPVPVPTSLKQIQPTTHRGKIPFLYPSLTQCLIPDTCPVCSRLDQAGDITGQYCVAGFAYLAVIRVPDSSLLKGADSSYSTPTCMNLRTNIVYDVTRTRDPTIVVSALTTLLPTKCLTCFAGLSGPVIVLIMGQIPPVPPVAQLDTSYQVYILPVPATIVLPSCDTYSMYGKLAVPYSLLPIAPQPYDTNDCPVAGDQSCVKCQDYPDTSLAEACSNGFAIVAELNLAGPYFTSQRLPAISVKTTTTYYSKSVEVVITNPPPIDCIKGFFKITENIGLAPLNFPGTIIPFVSLYNCSCLSQGFKKLLIFSSGPLTISDDGVLYLSENINIAFLQPNSAPPTCGPLPPPPPAYVHPQPFYIPPHQVPPSPYLRPARVPLTYIPPPPPPPEYAPPTDPPPAYLLPPVYIPPPVKEPSVLPPYWYTPPHLTTLPPAPIPYVPEISSATELPVEETPPTGLGCLVGSCAIVDAKDDKEVPFVVNVDEDAPYIYPLEALSPHYFYGNVSVWAPSFEKCLDSGQRSCPHSLKDSPEKFEEFFCKAKTALIVAVGIDYSIVGNETATTKRLTFIQPELPYVGIEYDDPDDPKSLKVAVTRNKTMDRRIQQQDNADSCYKEKVLVLSDLSNVLKPRVVVGTLDIYIPGFCDSEIFDRNPSYGLLLSLHQPSDVKNPSQLTEDFAYIPFSEGRVGIPDCGKLPEEKPYALESHSTKFWVPKSPLESVACEFTEGDKCRTWTTTEDKFYHIPCGVRSAALVLIQNTSAGDSFGPNLEILETSHPTGEKVVTLNIKSNVDEDEYQDSQYTEYPPRCKYATVQILKDLSPHTSIEEENVLTIIASMNCNNPIFQETNEVVLLMTDEPLYPDAIIPLYSAEVVRIPPGTFTISFCNEDPPEDTDDETPLEEVPPLYDESVTPVDLDPFSDESVIDTPIEEEETSDTYEVSSNVETYEALETSCKDHPDDTCPVCEDIDSISSDVFCNSGLSLFAEVIEKEAGDGTCTNGIIASLYDITARNGIPESMVHKISYSIPSHCTCPALEEGKHVVLVLDKATNVTKGLTISLSLSQSKRLYSSPLKTAFPSCHSEDSVEARSKKVDNVFVIDSPYEKLSDIVPELNRNVCPTIDHTCPTCRNMDDKELENLYCSSEEVLLVSKSKSQKDKPRKFSKIGTATFTQHRVGSNYSLEMSIDKYESPCGLPLAVGNCGESLDRFYFDTEDESCYHFTYKGCGGNANNFVSLDQCENRCFVEDFCEDGILDIKKIVKSSDDVNYLQNKFHYALPEHCNCSQVLRGDKKSYLLSTKVEDLNNASIQLSRNYYFVPLSKSQRNKKFSCTKDSNTEDSNANSSKNSEAVDSTGLQVDSSAGSKKDKIFGFNLFG